MVDTGLPMIGSGICRLRSTPTQYPTASGPWIRFDATGPGLWINGQLIWHPNRSI